MKKGKKTIWWILFGFTALLTVVSFSITPEHEASAKDLFLYRLSGSLLFLFFAIAFLIQTDVFGIKQKLGLDSIKKKVLFWIATFVVSITAFSTVDGMTSDAFKEARSVSLNVTTAPTETPTATPTLTPTITSEVENADKGMPTEVLEPIETVTPVATISIPTVTETPTTIPELTVTCAPTLTVVPTSTSTPIPTNTPTPTLTPTATPIPTNTPVPTPQVSLEDSWFSVVYFDVGQGDAALVECDGKFMLIDGGTSEYSSTLYSYLKEREIDKLDIVVASHAHNDHVGGLAGALNYAQADLVLCPVTEYDTDEFRAFKKYAEKNGPGITVPKVGDIYQLSNATVTINGVNAGVDNDSSIIMTVEYRGEKFVFTGDAEYAAEVAAVKNMEGPVMVLKVSHHGSDTSSIYQFLREVAPLYAVISCGYGNEYGHPTETVLSRLNDAEAEILRTDLNGEIGFEYTDGEWYYSYEKEADYADILKPGSIFASETGDTGEDVDRNNTTPSGTDYIGNANTKVFHYPWCKSVKRMKESNKRYYENVTREDMIAKGYKSCGNCNP